MLEQLIFGKLSKGGHVKIGIKSKKIFFNFYDKQNFKKELV